MGNNKKRGRPQKRGLEEYCPLPHSIFTDEWLSRAEVIVDPTGEKPHQRLLVDKMAVRIYSYILRHNYFVTWNEDEAKKVSNEIGNGMNLTRLWIFLDALIKSGFLHEEMFQKHSILTSAEIQKRWLKAVSGLRRGITKIENKHLLIEIKPTDPSKKPQRGNPQSAKKIKNDKSLKNDLSQEENTIIAGGNSQKSDIPTTEIGYPHEKQGVDNHENEFPHAENTIIAGGNSQKEALEAQKSDLSFSTTTTRVSNNESLSNNTISNNISSRNEFPHAENTIIAGGNSQKEDLSHSDNANNSQLPQEEIDNIDPFIAADYENGNIVPKSIPKFLKVDSSNNTPYGINLCLMNYLYGNAFLRTREQHVIQHVFPLKLTEEERMEWGKAFNRQKDSDGVPELSMQQWCRQFKNWASLIQREQTGADPRDLLTHKDKKVSNGNQRTGAGSKSADSKTTPKTVGGVNADSLAELFERKRQERNSRPSSQGEAGVGGDV